MEAWLKFRAPGVTLPVGLSIGKLIFTALNRMEWVFVFIIMIWIIPNIRKMPSRFVILSVIILLILLIQTFLFLPELNQRAEIGRAHV